MEEIQKWGKLSSINRKSVDRDFELTKDRMEIGRGDTCDIQIDHVKVSKLHCILTRDAKGEVFIEDKSSNGTYLFDSLIGKDVQKQLNSGDIFYLLHKDKVKGKCEDIGLVYSPAMPAVKQDNKEMDKNINSEIENIKEKLKQEREKKK